MQKKIILKFYDGHSVLSIVKTSGKRVCRVEDSSDEEQEEEMTPKEKKKQLMKDMIDRLNKVSNY